MRTLGLALFALVLFVGSPASAQVPNAPTGPARDLPTPVLTAFEKAYPTATISEVSTERNGSALAFRVDSVDKGRRRVIVYTATGSVLETSEQVEEKDLPKPVLDAVHSHPKAVYVKGMKITKSITTYYQLTLRGTRKTTMTVRPDGSLVDFK